MKKKDYRPTSIKLLRLVFPKLERYFPSLAFWLFRQAFFVPIGFPFPEEEKKMIAKANKFSFKVAKKKIQCYSWGEESDPYVLFLHGWAGRATQFRKFISPFQQRGFRLIGVDGPAHGKSEGIKTSITEFESTLKKLIEIKGNPEMIIAHSFGGAATLFSISRGLPIKNVINIASPSIQDEIIKSFLNGVNGTWKTGEKLKGYILKDTGKKFVEFTSLYTARFLPADLNLLLVHDENDNEVTLSHAHSFIEVYPRAELFVTSGLGHTRILKDESVVERCIQFLENNLRSDLAIPKIE